MSVPSATDIGASPVLPRLRATTVDRDHVALLIEMSVADGSLTQAEADERILAARAAVHRDEFDALLADLAIAQTRRLSGVNGRSARFASIRSFASRRRVLSLVIVIVCAVAVLGVGFAVGFEVLGGGHGGHGGGFQHAQNHADR